MDRKPVEIVCSVCRAESFLLRVPKYDGFTKTGETLKCAACGHEYADESQVPFKGRSEVRVFTDADRPPKVEVFDEGEAERLCRRCVHYVVNPFVQWCARHKREVEATDTCDEFTPKTDETDPKKPVL